MVSTQFSRNRRSFNCRILQDPHYQNPDNDLNHLNPPLTRVSLRANHLRGSIILGNYGVSSKNLWLKLEENLRFAIYST